MLPLFTELPRRAILENSSRSREMLVGAIGRAISAVTARDARAFFEHCGYRLQGPPL